MVKLLGWLNVWEGIRVRAQGKMVTVSFVFPNSNLELYSLLLPACPPTLAAWDVDRESVDLIDPSPQLDS